MEYIINPMWFYWLQVVDSINTVSFILAVLLGAGEIVLVVSYVILHLQAEDDEDYKHYAQVCKKWAIVCGIVFACALLATVFVPTKDTCLAMMISKFATYDNAQAVLDTVKEATDYVLNAIAGASVA